LRSLGESDIEACSGISAGKLRNGATGLKRKVAIDVRPGITNESDAENCECGFCAHEAASSFRGSLEKYRLAFEEKPKA
jgi:hypothetical protein